MHRTITATILSEHTDELVAKLRAEQFRPLVTVDRGVAIRSSGDIVTVS